MAAGGEAERLRVWDAKSQNGMSFVNFNPVLEKPLPLPESIAAAVLGTKAVLGGGPIPQAAAAKPMEKA